MPVHFYLSEPRHVTGLALSTTPRAVSASRPPPCVGKYRDCPSRRHFCRAREARPCVTAPVRSCLASRGGEAPPPAGGITSPPTPLLCHTPCHPMDVCLHDSRAELHNSLQHCCGMRRRQAIFTRFERGSPNYIALPLGRELTSQTGLQIGL